VFLLDCEVLHANSIIIDSLLLEGGIKDYEYLNKSRSEVDGVNDKSEFNFLVNALEVVGFSQAEQFDLFRIVAAILHIGNIGIQAIGNDSAQITGNAHEKACHLLGVPIGEFTRAVLRPQVLAGREWVTQSRTKTQAVNELGALCKTLYEKMFGALVERVNKALERPGPWATFIGVLDIAGFEIVSVI
jgi:myosin protein heavy chain